MKILFITPSLPSSLHRVRSLHLLNVLSRSHDVRLVSLAPSHDPVRETAHLSFLSAPPRVIPQPFFASLRSCAMAPIRRRPLEVAYCASEAMQRAVQETIAKFRPDLLYVKRIRAVQFLPQRLPCPAILDVTDAMAASYRRASPHSPWHLRPVFWHEARTYILAEQAAARIIQTWVVASPYDISLLQGTLPPSVVVHVVPNVVDTDTFAPSSSREEPTHLLFSGLMDKVVNVSAAVFLVRDILPRIRARLPHVTLTIAGPNPTRAVRRLAGEPGVAVTGYVPDLRAEIARAAVVMVPVLAGTGTRNKILQAWAMGKAIVSTPEGAEGLRASHGDNILLAETAERFAEATVLLLHDAHLRSRIGNAGRLTVEQQYSLPALAAALEPVLAEVTERHAIIQSAWSGNG